MQVKLVCGFVLVALLLGMGMAMAAEIPDDWYALKFTDINGSVMVSSSFGKLSGKSQFTVEFWTKPIQPLGDGVAIFDYEQYLVQQRKDNTYRIRYHLDGAWRTNHYLDVSDVIDDWHHIAFSWDGTETRIYLNGELVISSTEDSQYEAVTQRNRFFVIGGRQGVDDFHGYLTEVRVWLTVRTPEEIKQMMSTRLTGKEEGLIGYWDFSEGSGPFLHDKSGNGNDGIISNAEWVKVADTK
ncbi:MAG TPA: LamG domain-containing protein [Firmicutes bacterium]|nr:LamG domain-containing protein [Bacillota bacterium]